MFRASGQLSASFLPGLRASEVSWQHSRIGSSRIWSENFRTLHTPRNPELLNSRHSRPPTWVGGTSAPRNQTRNANQYASPPPHSYDRSTHVGPGTGTAWSQDTVASFPAILRQATPPPHDRATSDPVPEQPCRQILSPTRYSMASPKTKALSP